MGGSSNKDNLLVGNDDDFYASLKEIVASLLVLQLVLYLLSKSNNENFVHPRRKRTHDFLNAFSYWNTTTTTTTNNNNKDNNSATTKTVHRSSPGAGGGRIPPKITKTHVVVSAAVAAVVVVLVAVSYHCWKRDDDPFRVLGIQPTTNATIIKRAFQRKAIRIYPD